MLGAEKGNMIINKNIFREDVFHTSKRIRIIFKGENAPSGSQNPQKEGLCIVLSFSITIIIKNVKMTPSF